VISTHLVVESLLLGEIRLRSTSVAIDTPMLVAAALLLMASGATLYRIDGVFLVVDLEVVALNEERTTIAFAHGGGEHHGDVLCRTLLGVGNLRAGDLENERARIE
jgi:hypothetical protein